MRMVALCLIAMISACGGGSDSHGTDGGPVPMLTTPGIAVVKVRTAGAGWVALTEKLRPLEDLTTPDRRLLVSAGGSGAPATIVPPAGWSLIDFAVHPSGQISAVLATDTALRLQRYAADGALIGEADFTDADAATGPVF